jgi:hypothetical protein
MTGGGGIDTQVADIGTKGSEGFDLYSIATCTMHICATVRLTDHIRLSTADNAFVLYAQMHPYETCCPVMADYQHARRHSLVLPSA